MRRSLPPRGPASRTPLSTSHTHLRAPHTPSRNEAAITGGCSSAGARRAPCTAAVRATPRAPSGARARRRLAALCAPAEWPGTTTRLPHGCSAERARALPAAPQPPPAVELPACRLPPMRVRAVNWERTQQGQARGGRGVEKADGAGLSIESGGIPCGEQFNDLLMSRASPDGRPAHSPLAMGGGGGAGGRESPSQGSQQPASITHPSRCAL